MNNYSLSNDSWFPAFKKGEETAFRFIYESFQEKIYLACYHLLKDEAEAEDITVQTFYTLWKQSSSIKDKDHLMSWLYLVARRNCLNHIAINDRKQKAFQGFRPDVPLIATEQIQYERIYAELINLVYLEVKNLPDKMREVFLMRYVQGRSADEVAQLLGISVATVYNHCQAALRKLRSKFSDNWADVLILLLLISSSNN
jgi:RNA polymerase sigma factor (sigma-70 family)